MLTAPFPLGCSSSLSGGIPDPFMINEFHSHVCHRDVVFPSYRCNLPLLELVPRGPLTLLSAEPGPSGFPSLVAPSSLHGSDLNQ